MGGCVGAPRPGGRGIFPHDPAGLDAVHLAQEPGGRHVPAPGMDSLNVPLGELRRHLPARALWPVRVEHGCHHPAGCRGQNRVLFAGGLCLRPPALARPGSRVPDHAGHHDAAAPGHDDSPVRGLQAHGADRHHRAAGAAQLAGGPVPDLSAAPVLHVDPAGSGRCRPHRRRVQLRHLLARRAAPVQAGPGRGGDLPCSTAPGTTSSAR